MYKKIIAVAIFALSPILLYAQGSAPLEQVEAETYPCVIANKASSKNNPEAMYVSLFNCIQSENYNEAVYLMARVGASARYDSFRVKDSTAHGVHRIMLSRVFEASPNSKTFQLILNEQLSNETKHKALCEVLKKLDPPSYYPAYMVNHGMVAMRAAMEGEDASKGAVVVIENPKEKWYEAIDQYLNCPAL